MSANLDEVKSVIAGVLNLDKEDPRIKNITLATDLKNDLRLDSMEQFLLIDDLERKYNIRISDKDAGQIKTVGDAINFLDTISK